MSSADALKEFSEALAAAGLVVEGPPVADGALHRCGVAGKPRGRDGGYVIHLDEPASCWWRNWVTDETGTRTLTPEGDMTAAERAAVRERIAAARKAAEEEQAKRHAAAAKLARALWAKAEPAPDNHPYLLRKEVPALGGLRQNDQGELLVPVKGAEGGIVSLQCILPEKPASGPDKRFLKGGRTAGGFFAIPARDGGTDGPLLIAEGYATAASLHMATGHAVLVAFNAGNLDAVARMARGRYPAREILICADNDAGREKPDGTPFNPGVEAATKAAQAAGAKLAVCPAHEGRATDFNDLHRWRTFFAVAEEIEKARAGDAAALPDSLPSGFYFQTGGTLPGLWHSETRGDGDPVETWVGGALSVLGATSDEHGNSWGLLLEWRDDDGNTHTWAMPKAMLAGRDNSAVLARLADEGWRFASGQRARNLLYKFLTEYRTERRVLCVPCTGWHYGAFVFPDATLKTMSDMSDAPTETTVCGRPTDVPHAGRVVLQVRTAHNPFRQGGTLNGWRETVGTWSRGNSRVMLALCASLASALLEPSGMESGGFNWIGASSTGKTTALVAGGSVWGKGTSSGGYVQNWRATSNGLEGLAALHSDAALCLDEIGQAPGRTIMEAAYMLANGMGKSRAFQDGSARIPLSWRCMVLSTGEKGLSEKITEEGGRVQPGQLVRLIDVPADAGRGMGIFENLHGHESPQVFSDAIKRAAAADYGHAARAFIGALQQNHAAAMSSLAGFMERGLPHLCRDAASGQVQRVARRFLLSAAAGELAAGWGILPWEKNEALDAVKACFEAWIAHRGGSGPAEETAILEQVMLFFEQHGASRFQDVDAEQATCVNRAGFRRKRPDGGTEYLVLPESFRAEICKGHPPRRAAMVLVKHGLLLQGEGRNLMRQSPVPLPGFGRKRCYTLLFKEPLHDVA